MDQNRIITKNLQGNHIYLVPMDRNHLEGLYKVCQHTTI